MQNSIEGKRPAVGATGIGMCHVSQTNLLTCGMRWHYQTLSKIEFTEGPSLQTTSTWSIVISVWFSCVWTSLEKLMLLRIPWSPPLLYSRFVPVLLVDQDLIKSHFVIHQLDHQHQTLPRQAVFVIHLVVLVLLPTLLEWFPTPSVWNQYCAWWMVVSCGLWFPGLNWCSIMWQTVVFHEITSKWRCRRGVFRCRRLFTHSIFVQWIIGTFQMQWKTSTVLGMICWTI